MDIRTKKMLDDVKQVFIDEFEKAEENHQKTLKRHEEIMKKIDEYEEKYNGK